MPAYAERGVVRRASGASICDAVRVRRLGASMAKMAASTHPTTTCAAGNALSGQTRLGLGPVQRLSAPSEHLDGQLGQLSLAPAA